MKQETYVDQVSQEPHRYHPKTSMALRLFAVIAVVILFPLTLISGAFAALFLLQEFINGWIPSRWFSNSAADWLFGSGSQDGARNYFGFMIWAVSAACCGKGVKWGYQLLRPAGERSTQD